MLGEPNKSSLTMTLLYRLKKTFKYTATNTHKDPVSGMFKQSVRLFYTSRSILNSSCKEGTPIKLNVYKAGKPLVALKDEEYPEWLWTLLDKDAQLEQLKNEDYFRYKRKLIKKQNVANCKMNNFMIKMNK